MRSAARRSASTRFEIHFVDASPSAATLRDALASLPEPTKLEQIDGRVARCEVEGEGSKFDGHRRWLPRWFYRACAQVFDPLHREFAIDELRFPGF